MTGIFRTHADRASAAELRRLLIRLQNGEGEDRALGADIREAFNLPHTAGDPTGCIDCALAVAVAAKQDPKDALKAALDGIDHRLREGWQPTVADGLAVLSRAVCLVVLKCKIAKLEAAPI